MRPTTSCRNTVYELFYNSSTLGKEPDEPVQCSYGKSMEKLGIEKFENETNFKVNKCGLFIDNTLPYLGASPDGIIDDNTLLEIKSPYSAKDCATVQEAIHTGKEKMEPKLKKFYCEYILPKIIDPQYGKRLLKSDIVEPDFIIKAQKKRNWKIKKKE
ncbi:unnamed protein product [Macrosiphum euphorbiae]|uniref:YqaJ viral recombinase domain-containing protein n=1 Tax=Macrosiphum euphorbiae TaxID=13131 RepID=A0AAV0VMY7_9HEMI|nr:unnamed protein product [Macrosiphum euphorbiae]